MVQYNLNWLKGKGFFEKSIPFKVKGKEVLVDDKNLLAYVEVSNTEEVEELKKELSAQKVRYLWFFFPETGKLRVFRNIGGVKWFYYSTNMRSDYLKSRIDKLSKFSPQNLNILFDIRDIVEKFYWQLWEMRLLMARSISEIKEDKNKLLVVQYLIDRLIFFYFLSQLKLVKIINKEREWVLDKRNTRKFFEWICDKLSEEDLQEFLNRIFFDVLGQVNETGWGSLEFNIKGEKFSVVSPSLNGGLFVEHEIEGIKESKVKIKGIKKLILEVLNKYNWIIGEESPEEEGVVGDLTPEIIGHIYEKFVISLEQIGIGKIKLRDIQTVKEEPKYGRKKIGAYYTPEEITNYISMKTIYPYIRDKLKDKFGNVGESLLKNLFQKNSFSKEELAIVKYLYFEILTKIKICDNACGSGSFLIAAGEVLLRLYSRILKILEDNLSQDEKIKEFLENIKKSPSRNYYIVRQILVNNLYGVDIMESAIEIAKLRFWLWLISQVDPKKIIGKRIETLPDLDFNLVVGNSLIGFVDIEEVDFPLEVEHRRKRAKWISLKEQYYPLTEFDSDEKIDRISWLRSLAEEKQKIKTLPIQETVKLKEELSKELEKGREFLNKKFYEMLKVKGINITWEEFLNLKPFHWGFEFYEVFNLDMPEEERGFDIIIGNPPYGQDKLSGIERVILRNFYNFESIISDEKGEGSYNISVAFIEKSYYLMNKMGRFGYIVNNSIARVDEFNKLRNFLLNKTGLYEIVDVGNPFKESGVTLEMIILFFKKFAEKENIIIIRSKRFPNYKNLVKKSVFKKFNRFIFYYDEIFEHIFNTAKIKIIDGTRGRDIKKSKHQTTKYCIPYLFSGKAVKKYFIDENYIEFANKEILNMSSWNEEYNHEFLITTKISDCYRAVIKPKGYIIGNNVIKLSCLDKNLNNKTLACILNSHLMDFIVKRYIINYSELTVAFYNSITMFTPIVIPEIQQPFITLYDYMLYLNATEQRRNSEKDLILFINKQVIDPLVYELYFKEILKTNLLWLVEPYLRDIENLKSEEEKLKTIKQVVEKIKSDEKIMEQIEKIKSHPWIQMIEKHL
jgi:hypothetical protein